MSLFNRRSTSSQSSTQNTSSTAYTDSSINAGGDGSLALGAGAQVNTNTTVIDVSEGVARASLEANAAVSSAALAAQRDVAGLAIETTGATAGRAFDAAVDLYAIGSRERADAMKQDALLLQSQQGLVSKFSDLTAAALERSQTPDSAVTRQLLWVVGIVAVAAAFLFASVTRRPAPRPRPAPSAA